MIDIEPKEEILLRILEKMQFQVGEIIACEKVKKSKKLLCSQVKIGSQVKTDRFRNSETLHAGRDGWQESDGTCKSETGKTGRCTFRRYAVMCRGCRG